MTKSNLSTQSRAAQEPRPAADAILAALAEEHAAAVAQFDEIDARGVSIHAPEYVAAEGMMEALTRAVAAIPARTLAGVRSKAKTFTARCGAVPSERMMIDGMANHERALVASILADVIALA